MTKMTEQLPAAEMVNVEALTPWAGNPRVNTHAVSRVADSITRFGFAAPILARRENGEVIAGHTRLLAAKSLGLRSVPVRYLDLSERDAHMLAVADNKLGEIADWDATLADVLSEFSLEESALIGFGPGELEAIGAAIDNAVHSADADAPAALDKTYTQKIQTPVYEPTGPCPELSALTHDQKTAELLVAIDRAELADDVKTFLRIAATRHTVFRYSKIAEYYAHADEITQDLMERSGLVIIDYDKAVENGFVHLSSQLAALAGGASDDE